jgi:hypothetical protein
MESSKTDDYEQDEMSSQMKLARCINTKEIMKNLKNTMDIDYSDKAVVGKIMNEVGQGFGFYIGVLYECCTMENTDESFLTTRNELILDIYTYVKDIVPIIITVLRKTR